MLRLKSYMKAATPSVARGLLMETDGNGLYLAGGTAVIPNASPHLDFVVDITSCGLSYVKEENSALAIGATTRVSEIMGSRACRDRAGGLLFSAASVLGTHTIRNLATVGGNIIAWNYPSDLPAAFLTLDASVRVLGASGMREMPLVDFYVRRREVFLRGDLIAALMIPPDRAGSSGAYEKLGRTKVDVAIVGCAAVVHVGDGKISEVRIALNGVGPIPVRATEAESFLAGEKAERSALDEAARLASESITPRSDFRASAGYRKTLTRVLVRRALSRAVGLDD